MIIGDGDIASVLPDREDLTFFASGVSNSQETNEDEYAREYNLLTEQIGKHKHMVYFSSLAIFYSDTRYTQHKRIMEAVTRKLFKNHTIIRLGNIDWGKNPHTLINHLKKQKKEGKKLDIQDVYRYIVNKEEFLHWISLIPTWSCEMNVPGQRMKVEEIAKKYIYD